MTRADVLLGLSREQVIGVIVVVVLVVIALRILRAGWLVTRIAYGHPEDRCQRCRLPNVTSWHAPSPLWNAVMRQPDGSDLWGIVCPRCFAELAADKGVTDPDRVVWCLRPHQGVVATLPVVSPDGREWDADQCLWVSP